MTQKENKEFKYKKESLNVYKIYWKLCSEMSDPKMSDVAKRYEELFKKKVSSQWCGKAYKVGSDEYLIIKNGKTNV